LTHVGFRAQIKIASRIVSYDPNRLFSEGGTGVRGRGQMCRSRGVTRLRPARRDYRRLADFSRIYARNTSKRLHDGSSPAFDLSRRRCVPQLREGLRRCIVYCSLLSVSGCGVVSSDRRRTKTVRLKLNLARCKFTSRYSEWFLPIL